LTSFFPPHIQFAVSRVAFVNTHLVFVYWLLFITNDPFHTGLVNTIDVKSPAPQASCTPFDATAAWNNTFWFIALWWLPHSGLSRNRVKALFGSSPTNPLDRPVFAFIAPISWLATLLLWQPVSDCHSMDVLTLNPWALIPRAVIILVAVAELLGLFYLLPSHVFGTDRHTWLEKPPVSHDLIVAFPYALVRHPAAAAFLWLYWTIPSYNANHLLLAVQWSIFIIVGTLWEEGGLTKEFAEDKIYLKYRARVSSFVPTVWSVKKSLGLLSKEEDWDAVKHKAL
jgi:protein-S-isoprenylcysteine O-methyltransferase Ste14